MFRSIQPATRRQNMGRVGEAAWEATMLGGGNFVMQQPQVSFVYVLAIVLCYAKDSGH